MQTRRREMILKATMPPFRDSVQASGRATGAWQAAPGEAALRKNAAQHERSIRLEATQNRSLEYINILI